MTTQTLRNSARGLSTPEYADVVNWPGEWLIARTNASHLNHATEFIEDTGVAVYLPRVLVRRHNGCGYVSELRPLFPGGYLFCAVPFPSLLPDTKRDWQVFEIIRVPNQIKLRTELAAVQAGIAHDPYARLHSTLRVGQPVEVITGPLRGKVGRIVRIGDRDELLLDVTIMGTCVAVELGAAQVEPVN